MPLMTSSPYKVSNILRIFWTSAETLSQQLQQSHFSGGGVGFLVYGVVVRAYGVVIDGVLVRMDGVVREVVVVGLVVGLVVVDVTFSAYRLQYG